MYSRKYYMYDEVCQHYLYVVVDCVRQLYGGIIKNMDVLEEGDLSETDTNTPTQGRYNTNRNKNDCLGTVGWTL